MKISIFNFSHGFECLVHGKLLEQFYRDHFSKHTQGTFTFFIFVLGHCFIIVLKTTGHVALGDILSCFPLSSSSLIPLYLESVCSKVEQ